MLSKFTAYLNHAGDFRRKLFESAILSSSVFIIQVVLRILNTIILTRILAPDIFGVFVTVVSFVYIVEMFSDFGIRHLVITKRTAPQAKFLRSCWTVQAIRGLMIYGVCLGIAGCVYVLQRGGVFGPETAYAATVLPYALATLSIASVINGFASPNRFVVERNMQFKRYSAYQILITVINFVATIAFALYLKNVWALVYGGVIHACANTLLSFWMFPGPSMRFVWRRDHNRLIFGRGKWIVGRSALTAIHGMAEQFMFGLTVSASNFGFYYIAKQIINMADGLLSSIHDRIGLQLFTKIQKDHNFIEKYYKYRLLFDSILFFSSGCLVSMAPLIVDIIYDDRYQDVAGIIQVLAFSLILISPNFLWAAFDADRTFNVATLLVLIRTVTIWSGMAIAILVFDSVWLGYAVVAFHRLPETLVVLALGARKGWVSYLKEIRLAPVFLIGLALGAGIDRLWYSIFS